MTGNFTRSVSSVAVVIVGFVVVGVAGVGEVKNEAETMMRASARAASTILIFFRASMAMSEMPHCLPPERAPEPRSIRSCSASSKPFLAVVSAFNRSIVFSDGLCAVTPSPTKT